MTVTRNTPKKRSGINSLASYPVDAEGNLLGYIPAWPYAIPRPPDHERGIFWRENEPFVQTLTLEHIFHGQSAANFVWRGTDHRRWPMFLADVEELMVYGAVRWGQTSGLWQVRKRGMNYGLAMAPADKNTHPS